MVKLLILIVKCFGCLCFASNTIPLKDKFAPRVFKCVLLGYAAAQKAYKVYDVENDRVFVTRDILFHENEFPFPNSTIPDNCPIPLPISDFPNSPIQKILPNSSNLPYTENLPNSPNFPNSNTLLNTQNFPNINHSNLPNSVSPISPNIPSQ